MRLATLVAFALTMTVWSTVVQGHGWYLRSLALIAMAAGTAALAGRLIRPRGVGHLAALVVGVAGMTWLFSPGLGPVPTPSSFAGLQELLQAGSRTANTTAAPLPSQVPVVALVTGALFLLWWSVDLIAVGAAAPALGAAGLLALYAVPAAVLPHAIPLRYLAAGTAGLVVLLAGDRRWRLARWGRPTGGRRSRWADLGIVAATVAAFGAAVVVPPRFPATSGGWVYESRHTDSGTSTALSTDLDLRSDLVRPTDRSLVRYTSTATDPDPLRMFVVDSLDGDHWTAQRFEARSWPDPSHPRGAGRTGREVSGDLKLDPSRYTTRDQRVAVTVKALHQKYLPNPGDPLRLTSPAGSWAYDAALDTFAGTETTRSTRYTVRYRQYVPRQRAMTRPGLRAVPDPTDRARLRSDLALPASVPAALTAAARRVAGPATASDYVRAQRLQAYFHSGDFTYSTQVGGSTSPSAMVDFLRDKRGYCVHFATTMTLMARSLGIPARVVVGLAPGDREGDGWVAREHDAHAWPELYFSGIGWVRFEPTPGQTTPDWTVQAAAPTPSDSGSPSSSSRSSSSTSTSSSAAPTREVPSDEASDPARTARSRPRSWAPWVASGGMIALAVAPALAGAVIRRRRRHGHDSAEVGWNELCERVSDLGVAVDPARTVRDTGETIVAATAPDTAAEQAVRRRVHAVESARYAAGTTKDDTTYDDVELITRAVATRAGWRRRLLARCLPRAVFRRGRH